MTTEPIRKLRVGAVNYLNTKPLIYDLERLAPQAELVLDLPSRLADDLAARPARRGADPVDRVLSAIRRYTIVSDACIACRGPVLSVKLFSRGPIESIRTLALDEGSRTSVALVRILLNERFGVRPQLEPLPVGASLDDADADAVLLIGDRAMHSPAGRFEVVWDLGDEWCRWAELPFVFAMWVARAGAELDGLDAALARSPRRGRGASWTRLPQREAAPLGLTRPQCLSYLRDNLHFYLGPREQRGLELFYREGRRNWASCPAESNLDSTIAKLLDKAVAGERLSPDEGLAAARVARPGGAGPRGRRRHAPAASRAVPHLQHRPQHQLHERLHGGLRLLRVLPQAEGRRRLRARARRAAAKDPGDGRPGRRSDSDAGRPASRASSSSGTKSCCATSRATFRRSTSTASARRRFITSPRSPSCRCATVLERLKAAGLGSLPGGGGGDSGRSRAQGDHARQGADRRLAERPPRLARAGRPQHGHDDVRPRRNAGRADRAPGAAAAAAGRDRRLHGVYLLDVSARAYRHGPRAAGRLVRVSEDAGRRPAVPRQLRQHPVELGHAGAEDRPDRPAVTGPTTWAA